jgi:excisionase family DNA binding protein
MEAIAEKAALGMVAACEYLNISRPTLYRLMDSGAIRSFRIGRRRLCLKSDLDLFIQEQLAAAAHDSSQGISL